MHFLHVPYFDPFLYDIIEIQILQILFYDQDKIGPVLKFFRMCFIKLTHKSLENKNTF